MKEVSIRDILGHHGEQMALRWIAGKDGDGRVVCSQGGNEIVGSPGNDESKGADCRPLVGYLSLIHPNQIQVIGEPELNYFRELRKKSYLEAVTRLFEQKPASVVVVDDLEVPPEFISTADASNTPVLITHMPGDELVSNLGYYLTKHLAQHVTLHGVLMEVMGAGVLIVGESGVGKSELALELVSRGHRLIADDAPEFSRPDPDSILGSCPPGLENFMEVRGLGIINVRALFGDNAIKRKKYLRLIVNLVPLDKVDPGAFDRLEGSENKRNMLGVDIPEIILPVAPGRNLAVLIECAARNRILQNKGYSAPRHFMDLQRQLIEGNTDD